ncbi:GcvT family protein [Oharaeibacter diazotrophicus]|uniref:4-methylaminobutanoate oxidase (Formaldehyde-forming) n=1 Tax=Oharaeibacter diazotrophicus TaxID=1920512 RepID=A0A4R6RJL3_9HYPH|nr:FAD-dependent oxidoreductase [Oharaeibacter diazotrophicus]TDP86295.1 4-methylaminobutanoate oxidase (formaldehyde-forming) [Oharaeibacter diazotrophicus]BBE71762.1 4-methylaminobutanoate oxidase (formaldehyde-forming) [Pleomorphomonas sp. SM30]GLS78528.1 FAD-dependent oxidoreductase [Oharaeibacter diazotrophicus]
MSTPTIPTQADVVVIGGGIVGCSTAYHLARDHRRNVLLLESGRLTNGSTWHAAGLVGQLRTSASITRLLKYSVELYSKLEAETGLATGWKQNGGLRLACNQDRWIEIKRQATTAKSFGLEMHLLSPKEALDLWPLMDPSDLVGAAFLPTDGQASPSDITQSLAKGARMHGAKIVEGVAVTGFRIENGRVTGLDTTAGPVACEKVVICAGMWSKEVGRLAGVSIPLQPVQHQYILTEKIDGVSPNLPTLRDPDRLIYFKEEVGGLSMGGYETNPIAWAEAGIPKNFEFQLLDENWDHFEPHMIQAIERVPALANAGVKQMINGPESFTPDGNFMLGEAPEVKGVFVGCGFNAFGIASGGGAGWALANWVETGEQPMDLWVVDIRRFAGLHRDDAWVCERTLEAYGKHYSIAWPHEEYKSARPRIVSPLYERLKAEGAVFGSKLGWERPNWFAAPGEAAEDVPSQGRTNWFEPVGAEHRACREAVVVFDQSSFAKFEVSGPKAAERLEWVAANRVARGPGRLTYTQMLNSRGGIECDLTVAQIADDRFYVVTGTGFRTHDGAWIRDHLGTDGVTFTDVTEDWGTLSLMGPKARDVLAAVTDADMSNAAAPFGSVRDIVVAGHPVRALRVTYVGELGWELHVPLAATGDVFDALMAAGAPHGIRPAGYRAIESLRLEKGYRAWGSDITPNDSPVEAGLGWAVKLKSNLDFLGRAATAAIASAPLKKRLVGFTVADPDCFLVGRETILRDGVPVGYLASGGWGYTVDAAIGYGYVRREEGVAEDWLTAGRYELDVANRIFPATLALGPLYDPAMARVKA